jgi:hypothetical protein
VLIEHSPEIRTPQVIPAIAGAAFDVESHNTESAQSLAQSGYVEGGMNGVAGAGVVQGEGQQHLRRQAGARSSQPDTGRREIAQIL